MVIVKLNIDIDPADIKTARIGIYKRNSFNQGTINFPKELIKRHGIEDGDQVVFCFIKRIPHG